MTTPPDKSFEEALNDLIDSHCLDGPPDWEQIVLDLREKAYQLAEEHLS